MRNLSLFLLLACPLVVFSQIGATTQHQSKIYGIWQNSDFGYQMTLMLNPNGTGEFDGEEIKFSTQANKLTITQQDVTNNYTYMLQGNALTLSGGDLDKPITFLRNGESVSNNTIASQPSQPTKTATTSNPSSGGGLVGAWSGQGETIEFKNNGQCAYLGNTFPYQVSGNYVTLQTSQGNVSFEYKISGNQLSLGANGKTVTYSRGTAGAASAQTSGQSGKGHVAQEFVGKWCYVNVTSTNSGGSTTDECITLNSDGTYAYYFERSMSANTNQFSSGTSSQNSDRGTWSYDDARIYYNSQTNGSGSYVLEKRNHPKNNDPMIVLDGKTFVTFYQKSPW